MKAKITIIVLILLVAVIAVLLATDVIVITKPVERTQETIAPEEKPIEEDEKSVESVSGELGISNIVFCSERPEGYMDYEEQPNATFEPGDVVWIYFNLDGVKYNLNQDNSKEVWVKLHLTLKSPEGAVLLDEDLYNEHKNFEEEYNVEELFLRVNINTTEELAEGKYIAESTLRDELADKETTASSSFWLEG